MKARITQKPEPLPPPGQIQLPDFGIPQWCLGPVELAPSLFLYREDLGINAGFFHEFTVSSLDEALIKFLSEDPFWCPIRYRFSFLFASLYYGCYVSSPLFRRTWFDVDSNGGENAGALWGPEEEGTIFEIYIDKYYRRRLRVGGHSQEQAEDYWHKAARFLRKRIRILKRDGAIPSP